MRSLQCLAGLAVLTTAMIGCGGSNQTTLGSNGAYGSDGMGFNNTPQQQQAVAKATDALNSGVAPQLLSGVNQFGLDMFQKVTKAQPTENLCISPVSVSSVMGVLYNGTTGDTQKEIVSALKINKLKPDQINDANKNLSDVLTNLDPKKIDLNIANSMWVNSTLQLAPTFVQKNQQYYNAKVTTLDFTSPAAPSTINDWCKDTTKGKIPQILTTIPTGAQLVVLDAVYFKGSWQKPFDVNKTALQTFTLTDGTKEQVATMDQTGSFNYFSNADATGVALPYGSGRLEMDLIVPGAGDDLPALEKKLSANSLTSWLKKAKTQPLEVALPTFQATYSMTLNDTLKSLGVVNAFDPAKADFSPLVGTGTVSATSNPKLYLSSVKQKTYIEVNELGTEAAAATTGVVSVTAVLAPQTKFFANKPFVYLIRDSQTGVVLFAGTVIDPSVKLADGDVKPDKDKTKVAK